MTLTLALRQRLGDFTLDVAFTAPQGVTVLFGASGSGKSSTLSAVAGLSRPDQGQIICAGRVLFDSAARRNLPPHQRRLGVIFQEGRLFPHLTVRQNLTYGRWFARPRAGAPKFDDVVALLGIGHLLARRPAALSGGEVARVAIGRALLSAPDMILADEPLAALDEARRAEILPYFEALRDAALVPMLYVSHSSAEVARLATTGVALRGGRVVAVGSAADVLGRGDALGGAVSIVPAQFMGQDGDGLCAFATGFGPLWVPAMALGSMAGTLHLRIAAQDVILARARPENISALNILQGRIAQIAPQGDGAVLVTLAADQAQLHARITARSAHAMALEVGQTCYAILKTVALAQ